MRAIQSAMTVLVVTGLASVAYAGQPAPNAAPASGALITSAAVSTAVQEPKPKETPEAKPPAPARQEKPAAHPKTEKKQDKAQSKAEKKQDKKQAKADQKADRKGGGQHGRIKDKDYKAHFGRQHAFALKHVVTTRHIVPNQTRFTYVGYTFVFVDPWPMGWGFDDDCYIDYLDGGYYMFDDAHPGVQVALMIVG